MKWCAYTYVGGGEVLSHRIFYPVRIKYVYSVFYYGMQVRWILYK